MKTKVLAITLIAAGFLIVNLSINSNFIGWVGHEKAFAVNCPENSCDCTWGANLVSQNGGLLDMGWG